MNIEGLIRELPKGIYKWYGFNKGVKALYITCGTETDYVLQEALCEDGLLLDVIDVRNICGDLYREHNYDFIMISDAFERCENLVSVLSCLKNFLNKKGKLIIATDNRMGIRYFCGDRDKFTDRNFDSIENYVMFSQGNMVRLEGRAYSKVEITEMLEMAGFVYHKFFSVFPETENPQVMFSENFTPNEQLDVRIFPQYNTPETVFLNEELLYSSLIKNGIFHTMANGFFVECPIDGNFNSALQVTISMDRGKENALCTIIRNDNMVVKKPLFIEGLTKAEKLLENNNYLLNHGVNMVNATVENDSFVMPYIEAESTTDYFRRIFLSDIDMFLTELDRFRDILIASSEHVPYEQIEWDKFEPDWEKRKFDDPNKDKWKKVAFGSDEDRANLGVILKRGYVDLVSLNCFYLDGEFIFYDQELYMDNVPVNAILIRTIDFIYYGNVNMERIFPRQKLLERYHLDKYETLWVQFRICFIERLKNEKVLAGFYKKIRRDCETINANRQRMNYSADEYDRLFKDIFKDTDGKKIYLFGSGAFATRFMEQFGRDYEIAGIIDNNPDKWGKSLEGVGVYPPNILQHLSDGSYKVIICIKNCNPIIRQLKKLGVRNYSVYDSNMIYERKLPLPVSTSDIKENIHKKYHIGYIAGVFDLFHIGHLNMFRRAKEQCDYLIVGVSTDEAVIRDKKTSPYIPFNERIELVRSCKYVDEAVEIPANNPDTYEAYRRYKFDVQFSGSDYENDPDWLAKQAYLRKHGSDMVFFPYTQSTSSTKLKAMIEKKLL